MIPQLAKNDARPHRALLPWLLCFLLALVAPAALRADAYTIPGTDITLIYSISGTPATATITDCNNDASRALVLPATLGGASVTSIGDAAFENCISLTSVSIPVGVTSIGSLAFRNCRMTSVTIPASVTSIGDYAFRGCSELTRVTIPASVTSIGYLAFYDCIRLTGIDVAEPNPNYASINGVLFDKSISTLHHFPRVWSGAYSIPVGVTSIGDYAFYGRSGLTGVNIPASVTSIGILVFANCGSLTSVSIPASVASIGVRAFSDCNSLTGIDVAASNPNYASINGVLYNKNISTLHQVPGALSGAYSIPVGVTLIGDHAFAYCIKLTSVTIPLGVTAIGDHAFAYCRMASITIPASVTSIGSEAFRNCEKLTSVTIPLGVTSIRDFTFAFCYNLTRLTICASVTYIDDGAFYSCWNLTSATFTGDAPTSFDRYAFLFARPSFTILYPAGAVGFSTPTWQGYSAQPYAPNGFAFWAATFGLTEPDAAALADSDADAIPNLLEYALDLDPIVASAASLPEPALSGNQLILAYRRVRAELTYTVQTTTDLANGPWTATGVNQGTPATDGTTVASLQRTGSRHFLRLLVTLP